MGFYNHHVMPSLINCLCGMSEVTDQRGKLVPQAEGLVVEVGIGSGHNLLCFVRFLMVEQRYSARSVLGAVLRPWTTVDMNSNPKHKVLRQGRLAVARSAPLRSTAEGCLRERNKVYARTALLSTFRASRRSLTSPVPS